jgi:hypothetical protein
MIVWSTEQDDGVPLLPNPLGYCNSVPVLAFVLLAPYVSTGTGTTGTCRRLSLQQYDLWLCFATNIDRSDLHWSLLPRFRFALCRYLEY